MATLPAPRDIYTQDVDFTALALQYPGFAKKLKTNKQLDFSDPESVRQLTQALLHRDFNLGIELPEDRLCPPVPNRFNYVLWIQDLLDSTSDDFRERYHPDREVIGLDIGTGASAIYPLLACRQHANWKFLATETDPFSAKYAVRNIAANGLQDRIKIAPVRSDGDLLPAALKSFESIDFVMTNPPFYASEGEMLESAKLKQRPPFSACTGSPTEMITPGGEVSFISKLIDESLPEPQSKIQWFTSMLGKLTSVSTIVLKLRESGCTNYAVTEFIQGQKTRRWAVAWSWRDLRPGTAVARGIPGFEKKLLPFPADFDFVVDLDIAGATITTTSSSSSLGAAGEKLHHLMQTLDIRWQWRPALAVGVGLAGEDVWSRKARRRKLARDEVGDHDMEESLDEDRDEDTSSSPALAFKISLSSSKQQNPSDHASAPSSSTNVHVRWLQGLDAVLFESFCGWLKRKLS